MINHSSLNEAIVLSFKNKKRICRKMCSKPEYFLTNNPSGKPLSTIFRDAIESKNVICVIELVRIYKIDLEKEVEGTSWLPLALAAMKNDVSTIQGLVILGSKIEGKSGFLEFTALHAAVFGDAHNACRELLELGADPLCRSKNWSTPMNIAIRMNCKEIKEILINTEKKTTN
jgi:ankyrin repeat protein